MLKVRRHVLPAPEATRSTSVAAALAADDPVAHAIAGVARAARVDGHQTLAELGLDSLGLVELATVLEDKLGTTVDDGDLRADMTVDQVRAAMLRAPAEKEGALSTDSANGPLTEPPVWPYTWGRVFRALALPFDLLYRLIVTRTIVLGAEHLASLPVGRAIIFAGHASQLPRYAARALGYRQVASPPPRAPDHRRRRGRGIPRRGLVRAIRRPRVRSVSAAALRSPRRQPGATGDAHVARQCAY